jgi:S-adenosylmethionine decarboxylase
VLENIIRSGVSPTSSYPPVRARSPDGADRHEDPPLTMRLWALDAWVRNNDILTDLDRLRTMMYEAADVGGVTVLGEEFCLFDNAAVTGVLVLAQSHLSIHTWPEFSLANIDLLSYGRVRGEDVLRFIGERLDAEQTSIACMLRGLP